VREEGKKKEGAGWAFGPGKEERSRLGRLVHAGRKGKKEKPGWAGPCRRKGREGEKKKDRVGRAKREKEGEKEMHLNFKFKCKWKTNNKTMQCSMKCTRPIFSYIYFYG
jgi:hypothetical protein